MLLAIDVGNTNTVFALFNKEKLQESWRCRTENTRTADEYAAFMRDMCDLAEIKVKDIQDVIISSVVPEANFFLQRFCEKYIGKEPVFISKDNVGIEIDLDRPEDVGADRLVNALAVNTHYQRPAIVLDFGTATTFDVIDAQGHYAGGIIAPGINLSLNALHQAASKLPKVSIQKPKSVVGKSTTEAMQSGVYWGYISLIEGIVARLKKQLGNEDVLVLATGGLAKTFIDDCDAIDEVDDHLTLKGLYQIYQDMQ